MDSTVIVALIACFGTLLAGGGGMFAFINSYKKNNQDKYSSTVAEWKELYNEMKNRLDNQEEENKKLRDEVISLKQELTKLNSELISYKKYDVYIRDLEKYNQMIINVLKPLIDDRAYQNLLKQAPEKEMIANSNEIENKKETKGENK